MKHKLSAAFSFVSASPDLKERTLAALRRRTARTARPARRWIPAVACLLAVVVALGGCGVYFTPTAVISVDVNPSVELSVNPFNRVISATGRNADGEALLSGLSLRFLDYRDAVDTLLAADSVAQCLSQGEVLSIAVADDNETRQAAMLDELSHHAAQSENVYCYPAQPQDVEDAHALGLSCGRYRVYRQILELDPTFSAQDAARMTMAQLRDLLAQLNRENPGILSGEALLPHHDETPSLPVQTPVPEQSAAQSSGQGQGQGMGHGAGSGENPGQHRYHGHHE